MESSAIAHTCLRTPRKCLGLVLLVVVNLGVHAAPVPLRESGFTADHVILQRGSDTILERSHVSVSADGYRVEQHPRGFQILVNHRSGELWIVDRLRGIKHQVPVVIDSGTQADPLAMVTPGKQLVDMNPGILDTEPCVGLVEQDAFVARWRGRTSTISTCRSTSGEALVRHWYDDGVGVVVRTMDTTGRIEELRNIVAVSLSEAHFAAPSNLHPVDLQFFFAGAGQLERYDITSSPEVVDAARSHSAPFADFSPGISIPGSHKE